MHISQQNLNTQGHDTLSPSPLLQPFPSGEHPHLLPTLLAGGGELCPFLRAAAGLVTPLLAAVGVEGATGLLAPLDPGPPCWLPPLPPAKVCIALSGRGYRER